MRSPVLLFTFASSILVSIVVHSQGIDCSPQSLSQIPETPVPKCAVVPTNGTWTIQYGGDLKGPIPLNIGTDSEQIRIKVKECGEILDMTAPQGTRSFKRTNVDQNQESSYENKFAMLKYTLTTAGKELLQGKISSGGFARDWKLISSSPDADQEDLDCLCKMVSKDIDMRKKDRDIYHDTYFQGDPQNAGAPWPNDDALRYNDEVKHEIATTNRSGNFIEHVHDGSTAAMSTNPQTCAINTNPSGWENSCFIDLDWKAAYQHELIHKRTCCAINTKGNSNHWQQERANNSQNSSTLKAYDDFNPKYRNYDEYMDNPKNYMRDEVEAYKTTVKVLNDWYQENCTK